jgi:hypothetical protein
LSDLTTASFKRLYQASHKRLRESVADQSRDTIARETDRLLDIEATKLLAQVTAIVNGSGSPTEKIGELVSLLVSCDDDYDDEDDDDPNTTSVDTYPHTQG